MAMPMSSNCSKTCRHYWPLDPQATASYINAYREMWDCDDKSETEEVEP